MVRAPLEDPSILLASLDHIGEAILVTDVNGCITYANQGLMRVTGYSPVEVLGGNPRIIASGLTPKAVYDDMWKNILSGKVWEGMVVNRRKDGTYFDCRLVIAPVVNEANEVLRFVSVQQDMTRHMEVRRALEQQADALEREVAEQTQELEDHARALAQAEKLATIGELSASIAHEILNPLMGISGAVQVLRNRTLVEDRNRTVLDKIKAQVDRLDDTVRGLLNLVRPRQELPRSLIEVHSVVRSSLALVRSEARASRVTVSTEGPLEGLLVHANPGQLRQVLLNLVVNALHAIGTTGGEVCLSWELSENQVLITVCDNGPGIPNELLGRIFEPLFTTRATGTGLGLSISRRIIQAHGGQLTAENLPERGACFKLRLPTP